MQIFENFDGKSFKLNQRLYVKNFIVNKVGEENIQILNAYDSKLQLLPSTHFSQVKVNNATFQNQESLMATLAPMLFTKIIYSDSILPNQLISIPEIVREQNLLTIAAGGVWRIDGIVVGNSQPFQTLIAYENAGMNRIDIIVAKSDGTFEKIVGDSSETTASAPLVPSNSLFVTSVNIFGAEIIEGEEPIVGTEFIKKSHEGFVHVLTIDETVDESITLQFSPDGGNKYKIWNATAIRGFGFATNSQAQAEGWGGKSYYLTNETTQPITLKHNVIGIIGFIFPSGADMILPAKATVEFIYDAKMRYVGIEFQEAVIPDLNSVLGVGSVATINNPFEVRTSNNENARGSIVLDSQGAKLLGESGSVEISGNGVTINAQGQAFNLSSQESNISAGAWGSIRMNEQDGMTLDSAAGKLSLNGAGGGIDVNGAGGAVTINGGNGGLNLQGGNGGINIQNPASYELNFSSEFTDRSLIDKEYVDNVALNAVSLVGNDIITGNKTFTNSITFDGGAGIILRVDSNGFSSIDSTVGTTSILKLNKNGLTFNGLSNNGDNTIFGYDALTGGSGGFNTAYGVRALNLNATGQANVAFGQNTLRNNLSGQQNVAVGYNTLAGNTLGRYNTAVGYNALTTNTTGEWNTAVGMEAGRYQTTAVYNVVVGYQAGRNTTEGVRNTFIGVSAGAANILGGSNVAVGMGALQFSTSSGNNTIIGQAAGNQLTVSTNNTFIGRNAGANITTGSNNLVVGQGNNIAEGSGITTGGGNTLIGAVTGLGNVSNNVVIADGNGNIAFKQSNSGIELGQYAKMDYTKFQFNVDDGQNVKLLTDSPADGDISSGAEFKWYDDIWKIGALRNQAVSDSLGIKYNGNPKFKIHSNGDIEMFDINAGIIMKSPSGLSFKLTVADDGQLTTTQV